ncbi:MAG: ribonuclease H-like domain-containing protein [Kiritimatiellae bacterium]|nr:ribonuclease H-like domain-containing protein [Kiritimatiellia bacterium]
MLTQSLCCFKGLTPESEERLWGRGCLSWRHLAFMAEREFSPRKCALLLEQLPLFETALEGRCADFFIGRLPCGHRMRILPEFRDEIAYLDIETDGMGNGAVITLIGLWWRGDFLTFVRGRNLQDFIKVWSRLGIVATFNGARFDLPVIMREFGFTTRPPQIDLMDEARHWGLAGGLKQIERRLGIARTEEESGTGMDAVLLWDEYARHGDGRALEKLIAYNARDVLSLPKLACHVLLQSIQNYPGPHPEL